MSSMIMSNHCSFFSRKKNHKNIQTCKCGCKDVSSIKMEACFTKDGRILTLKCMGLINNNLIF
jgi:hypothetical protein